MEFVAALANSLAIQLFQAEDDRAARERPNNPDAIDLAIRGWAVYYRQNTLAIMNEAQGYFERALRLDPNLALAEDGLARTLIVKAVSFKAGDLAEETDRADALATRVLSARPNDVRAHTAKILVLLARKQFESAIEEAKAAIEIDGDLAVNHFYLGFARIGIGRAAEGIPEMEMALRFSPRDPFRNSWEWGVCYAYAHLADWDHAIEWCGRSIATNHFFWLPYIELAAAYGWKGKDLEARFAVDELLKQAPALTVKKVDQMAVSNDPVYVRQYGIILEGLRKAGLAEQ